MGSGLRPLKEPLAGARRPSARAIDTFGQSEAPGSDGVAPFRGPCDTPHMVTLNRPESMSSRAGSRPIASCGRPWLLLGCHWRVRAWRANLTREFWIVPEVIRSTELGTACFIGVAAFRKNAAT